MATLLHPRADAFAGERDLDSARLEHAVEGVPHVLRYQHGVGNVLAALERGEAQAAVLLRPVSVSEIGRTAHEGLLMPPKSTFFTPEAPHRPAARVVTLAVTTQPIVQPRIALTVASAT